MAKKITKHRVHHKKDAHAGGSGKSKFSGSPGESKTMKNSEAKLPKPQSVHQHHGKKKTRRAR